MVLASAQTERDQLQEPQPTPWLGSTSQVPAIGTAGEARRGTLGTKQAPAEVPQGSSGCQAPSPFVILRELFKEEEMPSATRAHQLHWPPPSQHRAAWQHTWWPL